MSKQFTFAGTCTENNTVVYKFANNANRSKELERFGCTDVNMIALPNAMDKEAAIAYLATLGMTAMRPARGPRPQSAAKKTVSKKATVAKKATAAPVVKRMKRVPAEYKEGMDADAFAAAKFAEWDAKIAAKRAAGKAI